MTAMLLPPVYGSGDTRSGHFTPSSFPVWLRIREASGTIYWAYSYDGTNLD